MASYRLLLHLSGFNLLIFCGLIQIDPEPKNWMVCQIGLYIRNSCLPKSFII